MFQDLAFILFPIRDFNEDGFNQWRIYKKTLEVAEN